MSYCGPRAIPHSEFLSWDPYDQDAAKAWVLLEAEKCPGCGTIPSEWLDEEGREIEHPPFVASATLCIGCQALHDREDKIPKERRPFTHVFLKRLRGWRAPRS